MIVALDSARNELEIMGMTITLPTSTTYDRLATLMPTRNLTAWIKRDIKAKLAHRDYRMIGTSADFARMLGGTRKMK